MPPAAVPWPPRWITLILKRLNSEAGLGWARIGLITEAAQLRGGSGLVIDPIEGLLLAAG